MGWSGGGSGGGGGGGNGLRNWALGQPYTKNFDGDSGYTDVSAYLSSTGTPAYTVSGGLLTDGWYGSLKFNDYAAGQLAWIGWNTHDPVIRIDLGVARSISCVRALILIDAGQGIHTPSAVKVEWSDDDSGYTTVENRTGLGDVSGNHKVWITFDFAAVSHRYWRISMTRTSTNFLFCPEIEVLGV